MQKIKSSIAFLYEQFYHYLIYIIKHPVCSIVMAAGIILSFGSFAFATDYYVDSEVVINIPGTNYNWLEIGRYGLVITRKLLGTSWYNPYYTGILLLLFLWLTGMTFSYVAEKLFPKLTAPITTLGSLIFLTYPTFTEQYYFHFQSAEIALGLWLSMLVLTLFYQFVQDRNMLCFVITLPVYVLTFSIYQSFIPLALCGYLGIFLATIMKEKVDDSTLKRGIFGSILHFVIAFVISQGINKICFPASSYLNDQVIWGGESSPLESLKSVLLSCARMLTGQGVFYTTLLLVAIIAAVIALLCSKKLPLYQLVLGALSALGITITPFILTLLMAENTAIRSQFTYAFAAVLLLYFSVQTFLEKALYLSYGKLAVTALFAVALVSQIYTVRYIWNAHQYVAEYDRKTATDIMKTMYNSFVVDGQAGTIFWGYLQPETPYDEALSGSPSYLFTSVFNLEHNTEPYCFFSTNRILGYMESMGHRFTYPTNATRSMSAYIMNRETLPAYPDKNCYFNDLEAFTFHLGNCPDYYY